MKMSNKMYDTIKTIALIVVPLFAFVSSVVDIWGIPCAERITATLTAIDTLIGGLVIVAKTLYEKEMDGGEDD